MAQSWVVGTHVDCDLVVQLPKVSGTHCRLTWDDNGYILEDLGSTNGTYVNGVRISVPTSVNPNDMITLGLTTRMPWPSDMATPQPVIFRIGRARDNDLVVDLPMVSNYHARILWVGKPGEAIVEDLGSECGTSIGALENKISRAIITSSDTLYLGTHSIHGAHLLARVDRSFAPLLSFNSDEMVIGRDAANGCSLDFPMISSRHARLSRASGQVLLEDLNSSNGTFVNGERIVEPRVVQPGDLISLGSYTLRLAISAGTVSEVASIPNPEAVAALKPFQPALLAPPSAVKPKRGGLAAIWPSLLLAQGMVAGIAIVMTFQNNILGRVAPANWDEASRVIGPILFWSVFASAWFGMANALFAMIINPKVFVDDLALKRFTGPLVGVCILAGFGLLQCVICGLVIWKGLGMHSSLISALVVMFFTSCAGLAWGMLVGVAAPRRGAAFAAIPALLLAFWLFGGEVRRLPAMSPLEAAVSSLTPTRWGFEALLIQESDWHALAGVQFDKMNDTAKGDIAEPFFPLASHRMGPKADMMALLFMSMGLAGGAIFISMASRPVKTGLSQTAATP